MLGLYCRVSTQEQAEKGVSLKNQLSKGIEVAKKLNLEYKHYEDAGLSGSLPIDKRPGLKALIDDIQQGKITHLFVYDEDRLTRDVLQYHFIKSIFKEHNIKLYNNLGEVNMKDDGSVLLSDLKNLFAAYEKSKTISRIKFNLEQNAKAGKAIGGVYMPYGYTKDEKKMLIVHPEEAKLVRRIFQLSLENWGTRRISNLLNEEGIPTRSGKKWRDGTIYHILENPLYYGKRRYKGELYDVPPIISEAEWKMVQTNLTKNKLFSTDRKYEYLLKGLITCGKCGRSFYGRKRATLKDNQYCCLSSRYTKEFCGNRGINIDYLNGVLINSVNDLDKHIEDFFEWWRKHDMVRSVERELTTLTTEMKEVKKKIDNLLNIVADGMIDKEVFNEKIKGLNDQYEKNKKRRMELVPQLAIMDKKEEILKIVRNQTGSDRDRIRALVDRINILWVEEKKYHLILIDYKIDALSQYKLRGNYKIQHKMVGSRMSSATLSHTVNIRQIGSQVYVTI